ncbi:o-succinylbenzoate synthase [Microbacterium marinilacus]|uniref:o-succinylbenzoate synthase n=1 Tax=Microbacterium marinilacus TaxID=415209 RepID=A0ABP7BNP3_9MICO|nr:o-succinylbenzoate synthase [Microbacterium marinilacus]MBY0690367.1 o-succinylbenzoate synthase [Microbacterium marinilacus]
MRVERVALHRISLPLVAPFRTSLGVEHERTALLVQVTSDEAEGWGECVAGADASYSSEYVESAEDVLRRHLVPRLLAAEHVTAHTLASLWSGVKGHLMAKAALEGAVLDAELRTHSLSLASSLGAVSRRVPSGVSVGIMDSVPELLDVVAQYLAAGYQRIKLKIEPGWDLAPVRAVRERFGDDLLLQVDANTAYTQGDARHLARLDAFDLLLIEQPLDEDDLRGHAHLARSLKTPICLDESIVSARSAFDAISMGACEIINIKPGRVGGYLEARRIHDVCAAAGVPVWCGGMLETGIGRAGNVALSALPGFTLPGDVSASDRYYATDITDPFVLDDGYLDVPQGAGLGVAPVPDVLASVTTHVQELNRRG